jgi:hypothetical protein
VQSIDDRFDEKWQAEPNTGCHLWIAGVDQDGYGIFFANGASIRAHRFAWERERGPVPAGLVLDHVVCDTPGCVNPDHLAPTTNADNVLRSPIAPAAVNARKTHCSAGHPLDGDNLHMKRGRGGRLYRECRTCSRVASRARESRRSRRLRVTVAAAVRTP